MGRPTIKDVAKQAGVSVGTVSKVINKEGNVRPALQEKVWEAIKTLEYHPNAVARSLKSSNSNTIAVLLADLTNPFQMALAKAIEEVTYKNNYQILISSTKEDPEIEKKYLQMLYENRVEGFIVCSTGKANEEINSLVNRNIPVVLVDRPILSLPVDIVADDNLIGMKLLVHHLYELGHQRIGGVHGDLNSIHGKIRFNGFMEAVAEYGLDDSESLQYMGDFKYAGGVEAMKYFTSLSNPPTAIVSANNNMTAGILQACRALNIHIPDELSVVSFGELEYSWDLIKPSMTHVSQSPLKIGTKAAKILFERLKSSKSKDFYNHLYTPKLVERESTKYLS